MIPRRRRGAALMVALAVLVAVAALTVALHAHTRQIAETTQVDLLALESRCAADGALEHARWSLARDPSFSGSSRKIGRCATQVRVETPSGQPHHRTLHVESHAPGSGTVPHGAHSRLEVTLLRQGDGLPSIVAWQELP